MFLLNWLLADHTVTYPNWAWLLAVIIILIMVRLIIKFAEKVWDLGIAVGKLKIALDEAINPPVPSLSYGDVPEYDS